MRNHKGNQKGHRKVNPIARSLRSRHVQARIIPSKKLYRRKAAVLKEAEP